jgi:Cu(I)/Ag(I) efflux system membrane fusion protein
MSRSATLIAATAIAIAVALAAVAGYRYGAHQGGAVQSAANASEPAQNGKKLLYYRNPMGLPDTSPTPKKDSMGMDYVPVYEGEEEGAGGLKISPDKIQKLGVKTEAATLRTLDKVLRVAGRIEVDERRVFAIAPKFEGWVERLHVNTTGQPVGRGQPLFEVYSPELVSAQREYAIAVRGQASVGAEAKGAMGQLAEASLLRLRNWDISEEQVKALAAGGEPRRTLTFRSPAAGVVTEKKAIQGMRFMPGETLYQIADTSSVWVVADVYEQDIGRVSVGAVAQVSLAAYPEKHFEGRIAYIYPTLKAETRTVPVRIELANPQGLLKPAMYAQVELPATASAPVLTVPASAVIDSGRRQVVLVQMSEGRFEPREVKLGQRGDDFIEVRDGIKAGDAVVTSANFLIDAESNLRAAVGAFKAEAKEAPAGKTAAQVGHQASGTLDTIDLKAGSVTITHGPVASLKWPAMTMDFALANSALVDKLKPGAAIRFEFVERQPGEWVITRIEPAAPAAAHQH